MHCGCNCCAVTSCVLSVLFGVAAFAFPPAALIGAILWWVGAICMCCNSDVAPNVVVNQTQQVPQAQVMVQLQTPQTPLVGQPVQQVPPMPAQGQRQSQGHVQPLQLAHLPEQVQFMVQQGGAWTVRLMRHGNEKLGLAFNSSKAGNAILITGVVDPGLVSDWNARNPTRALRADDRIKAVNGMFGGGEALLQVMKSSFDSGSEFELLLQRDSQAQQVPFMAQQALSEQAMQVQAPGTVQMPSAPPM